MKLILSAILILCSLTVHSQKTDIGKPYQFVEATLYYYFRKGDEVLAVKRFERSIVLQKFNASLELEKAMRYDNFPKDFVMEEVSKIGDAYYVFYSWSEKGVDYLSAIEFNFSRGEFINAEKKMISSDRTAEDIWPKFQGEAPQGERGKYVFFYSQDSSRLAVCYRVKPEFIDDNKSNEVNGVWVFDKTLTEQWHGDIRMPYTEKRMDVYKRAVDSNGIFYFFIQKFKDNTNMTKKYGEDTPNYTLEIMASRSASASHTITPVNLDSKFIHSISFNEHAGKLVCSGYYNSGQKPADVEGIFAFTLNGDGTHSNAIKHPLPLSIINEGESKSFQKENTKKAIKKTVEFSGLKLTATDIQADGSLLIQGEQQRKVVKGLYAVGDIEGGNYNTNTTYEYENMLMTKLGADGSLNWFRKLRKSQTKYDRNPQKLYKYLAGDNGMHYFIFMDTKKNTDLAPLEPIKSYNSESATAVISAYFIDDKTGDVTKRVLAQMKDFNGQRIYEPDAIRILLSAKNLIFEGQVRISNGVGAALPYTKKEVLGKIELD